MPTRPLRACVYCPEAHPAGPCPKRKRAVQRQLDRERGSAASRGYGALHRRWRAMILARDPICPDPFGRHPGVVVPTTVADHIRPLSQGGDFSLENGAGYCSSCHSAKTALRDGRWGR